MTGPYVSLKEYREIRPNGEADSMDLEQAGYEIDSLVFGRIHAKGGIANCTEYQKELLIRAICLHAEFIHDYSGLLSSPVASYGINGVNMNFDSAKLYTANGVTTLRSIYAVLQQTGLSYRGLDREGRI